MQFKQMMAVMVITQLHRFVKAHQTVHLKVINFTVCKLDLDKADFSFFFSRARAEAQARERERGKERES